jgi:hypothetical protein
MKGLITNWVFTIILVLIILLLLYFLNCNNSQENWQSYRQLPFDYIKDGSSPLNFYVRNRYKKPYRYPLKHYKSYPYPNMSNL